MYGKVGARVKHVHVIDPLLLFLYFHETHCRLLYLCFISLLVHL